MPVTIEEEDDREPSHASESEATSSSSEEESPPLPAANYFAPPFYGRPGTPLPPSPSITSLLIPSRPTTPDLSDDDHHHHHHRHNSGAGTSSGTHAVETTTGGGGGARASPKVPTYEYYGFVVYLFSSLTFLVYLLWSYLPAPFLHALGIYYYPNRWWSLAVPAFLVMALVYVFVALAAFNEQYLCPLPGAIETVVDEAAQVAVTDSKGRIRDGNKRTRSRRVKVGATRGGRGLNYRAVWSQGTDAVMDIPVAGVCEVLYRRGNGGLRDEAG